MTLEELKAKAIIDYPVGTRYLCASGGGREYTVDSMEWAVSLDEGKIFGEPGKGCVYRYGKWAQIVSKGVTLNYLIL